MKCLIGTESEINAEDSNFIFSFQSTKTDISVTGSEACIDSIYRYCEKQMTLIDDIVENDISPKNFINGAKNLIECLMNNQNVIGTTCDDMNYIVRTDPLLSNEISSPCELELFNNCGDILVDLEIAIETDDVLEISQFSLAIASCINERMSFMQSACSNKNIDNNNDLIRDDIANEVTQGSIIDEATTNTIDMTPEEALCHKVLYETCGTSLSVLEHGLKQNNPNRIAEAAIEVTGCITKSFTGLSKTCSRFQRYFGFGDSNALDEMMNADEEFDEDNGEDINNDNGNPSDLEHHHPWNHHHHHHHSWNHHHHHRHSHHRHHHHPWDHHHHHHHPWHHHHHPWLSFILWLIATLFGVGAVVKGYKLATGRSFQPWIPVLPCPKKQNEVSTEVSLGSKNDSPLLKVEAQP